MKNLILGLVMVGALGAALVFVPSEYETVSEVIEIEKEVTPEWATDEEAVQAAQDVIERKRAEAELKAVQGEIEALRVREEALEKQLGQY